MAGLCGSATECTTYGREISARWIDRNCCELALRARRAYGGSVTDPSRGIGNRNNGFTRMNSPAKSREAQTGCSSERASSLPDARVIRLNIRALSSCRLLLRSSSQRLATQARCTPGLAVFVGRSRNRARDGRGRDMRRTVTDPLGPPGVPIRIPDVARETGRVRRHARCVRRQ